jgi:hypothetical protein
MDTRRSYYLLSRHDDFSELDAAELAEFDISDIPWVIPANECPNQGPRDLRGSADKRGLQAGAKTSPVPDHTTPKTKSQP